MPSTAPVRLRLGTSRRAYRRCFPAVSIHAAWSLAFGAAGAQVDTINFGPGGSADLVLGREIGRRNSVRTTSRSPRGSLDFWDRLGQRTRSGISARKAATPTAPGCAHLERRRRRSRARPREPLSSSRRLHAQPRSLQRDPALHAVPSVSVCRGGFPAQRARTVPQACRTQVCARARTSRACRSGDAASTCTCCSTEARRNIYRHFEDLDLNRFELVMPFYDCEMVAGAVFPLDPFIGHRLYYRWLSSFRQRSLPSPGSRIRPHRRVRCRCRRTSGFSGPAGIREGAEGGSCARM